MLLYDIECLIFPTCLVTSHVTPNLNFDFDRTKSKIQNHVIPVRKISDSTYSLYATEGFQSLIIILYGSDIRSETLEAKKGENSLVSVKITPALRIASA